MRSDRDEVVRDASAPEHPASLSFRGSTPHAVVDAVFEGVVEAFAYHRAGGTNALCHLNADPMDWEEGGGGMVFTVAVIHPGGGGFHVWDRTDEGRKRG